MSPFHSRPPLLNHRLPRCDSGKTPAIRRKASPWASRVSPSRFALLLCSLCALLGFAPAHAEAEAQEVTDQAVRACTHPEGTPEQTIAACSAVIDSGTLQGQDLAGAYASRGFARTLKRDLAGAESDLDQAIKIAPDDAQAYVDCANLWNVSRKADRAMADAEQAVRLDPHFPLAYFVRGSAVSNLGQYDRAIADYRQALKVNPNYKLAAEMLQEVKAKR